MYLWWEKIGLSNLMRPGRYPPPLNATTIQPLGTGGRNAQISGSMPRPTLGLVRVPGNLSQNIGVGKAEMTRTEEAKRGGCSSTRPSVGILLDPKFELPGKVYNSRLQAVRSKNLH